MELFLELTRRCNLKCTHCLRGNAQGKDMPEHILWHSLQKLGHYGYLGIGGGESLMTDTHIRKLRNAVLQTGVYKYLEYLYLVTNGKRVIHNKTTRKLLEDFPVDIINLHVSTDRWHDIDAHSNLNTIRDLFEWNSKIQVHSHGPSEEYNIVNMGRAGRGKNVDIHSDDNMLYVDVNGFVWGSCDLSYTFMKKNTDKAICYGNIVTDSEEDIMRNHKNLSKYLNKFDTSIEVNEDDGGFTRSFIKSKLSKKPKLITVSI